MGNQRRRTVSKRDIAVALYIHMNGNAIKVDTTMLCMRVDDAIGNLQRQRHNHSLANDKGRDPIVIRMAVMVENLKSRVYQYTFHTTKEVRLTIADGHSAGMYA